MKLEPDCPKCNSTYTYADGINWVCPECGYEWSQHAVVETANVELIEDNQIRDANGVVLQDGDTVIVIKELRIKGSSSAVKVGTKVKGIRLTDGADGHNIACKIDGIGAMNLKSEFVRKS
jgi:protein PhnA